MEFPLRDFKFPDEAGGLPAQPVRRALRDRILPSSGEAGRRRTLDAFYAGRLS